MTQEKINSKEFADEIFRKVECINKFYAKLEDLTSDAKLKENIRIAFSNFLIEYHQ